MKNCKTCLVIKPLEDFYRNSQLLDGRANFCKACVKKKSSDWYASNKELARARQKDYQFRNRDKLAAISAAWTHRNRERSREIKAAWKKRNPETVKRHARESSARIDPAVKAAAKRAYRGKNKHVTNAYNARRRAENINQRVHDAVGNRMIEALRKRKSSRSWVDLAGYSCAELMKHLESLFSDRMSWDNFGEWHIDHIRPVCSFNFEIDYEKTIRSCWSLKNLQPLWAIDNVIKNGKWDGIINADL